MRRVISTLVVAVFVITTLGVVATPSRAPAQAADAALAAVPGTVIVDEQSDGFTPKGFGWRSADFGYAGHHFWARTSRTLQLVGIWRATLEPGLYRVLAKVPTRHASSRKAVYKVRTADGWHKRVRNQSRVRGKWVSLGVHDLAKQAEVRLADKTNDPLRARRKLAFDAVKFVAVDTPKAPAKPGGLEAVATGPDRIKLTWTDRSGNEDGFYLDNGPDFIADLPPNTESYVVRNLAPATYMCFHLYAYNEAGKSEWTPYACATTPKAPAKPVISDIVVKPEEFRAVVTFSLDAKGPARTEYKRLGGPAWIDGPNETSSKYKDHRQVIAGLKPETDYEVRVIATNTGGTTVSDSVPFKTKQRTVDCDKGEDLGKAISDAKAGDTLIIDGQCSRGAVIGKDLTLRGGTSAEILGSLTAAAGARVTVVGISLAFGGTNRGRLVLTDCDVAVDCSNYENAAGARLILERTTFSGYDLLRNAGVLEALDSTLRGGCITPSGIENVSSGTMTLRRTSIGGTYYVLGNSGTAVLDEVTMKGVNSGPYDPVRNQGTMTIRDSRFIDNSGADGSASVLSNRGTVTVKDSVFLRNRGGQGAIVNTGDITLTNVTFSNNEPADCVGC